MGIKGKVKKLGGVKKVGQPAITGLTLEAKKKIGESILSGDMTVKEIQRIYGVTPQAVGWWKRLAEREEMVEDAKETDALTPHDIRKFKGVLAPRVEGRVIELLDELEDEIEPLVVDTTIKGFFGVEIKDHFGRVLSCFTGCDLKMTRDITGGFSTASWKEDE
jgi:transposase-like protein